MAPISHTVNDTHYELTYRCENCWTWDQAGATGSQVPATTASAAQLIGWAQATNPPSNPSEADSALQQHANDGIFGAVVASARNTAYTSWASLATATATAPYSTGNSTSNATATGTAAATTSTPAATSAPCPAKNSLANTTYDYIIVGGGAGGIPLADRLSETGKSVLLIERGPPSSGRWGGTLKPDWLNGTNLTRFDVPGLDNEIWANSTGIACEDYSVMAGCVLGGGTAVNAGLWWHANPADFDYNFPAGWKASDMEPSIERVFERIPFTQTPSTDGILYKPGGYNIIGGALAAAGWQNVTADDVPGKKNWTFSHPNEMFSHGERGGPMATYLVTANARKNFKLVMGTNVNRVIRDGTRMTGVEMQAYLPGGMCGTVKVTPNTGKVILAAGAFGTPKILFRSGIGPQDQLEIVQGAEGSAMVNSSQWINLPVGYNLDDHTNTDIIVSHPNVSFYDFYAAYSTPIAADANRYLANRTGILAQSAPNLSVFFWQEIDGADGITRQLQWTARVESGHNINNTKAMTISQYLGRGATSRGRTTINGGLDMTVSTVPYLQTTDDLAAVAAGIETLKVSLAKDPQIQFLFPASNQTTADFLSNYTLTTSERSANHWMGSCKMGLDSGLVNNGTSVVDTNTKVYGTDNLFIVDASIFPGLPSTNPSALIVAVAEKASGIIPTVEVAVSANKSLNSSAPYGTGKPSRTGVSSSTGKPRRTGFSHSASPVTPITIASSSKCTNTVTITRSSSALSPTLVSPVSLASSSSFPTLALNSTLGGISATGSGSAYPTGSGAPIAMYQRCGGIGYAGSSICAQGLTCKDWNPYYYQCVAV